MSLDIYVPEARQVEAGGKTLVITPLKVRQIAAFTRAVMPVLGPLSSGDFLAAVAQGGDHVARAIAIATGETEEWIGELMADEFMTLAANVIEVNADFFIRRVLPTLNAATEKTLATLGVMSSPPSAPTDTSIPASSSTP